ncbi:related to glycolate oxidase [Phialocephala subalpina]|uniref:Related to glycolate oxidase n=1 Tax=Phialocephala subalpina TaxID=576137 RepID=A0A1L7XT52_9HELO|nr:related to glycolate oxidase [Phialocephala subalpina]
MSKEKDFTIRDIREDATKKLGKVHSEYINEGAMGLITVQANELAYNRYRIIPRILRDVSNVDTSTTIFGTKVTFPFGFSPAAMHMIAHPSGEIGTSSAASKAGIAMGVSHWATKSMEDIIAAGKNAEGYGYKALLVTVDAPIIGRRLSELRNGIGLPEGMSFPNVVEDDGSTPNNFKNTVRDASTQFSTFLPWLVSVTPPTMEIWLKGIYHPEDVLLASSYPIAGIIVSNHGGRQLDTAPAILEALPACAAAARSPHALHLRSKLGLSRLKVGIDGGIRRGSDIFKALALGADMCFAGRIPIWGLAVDGEDGVSRAIEILRQEFEVTMMLAGCISVGEITKESLAVVEGGVPGIISRL